MIYIAVKRLRNLWFWTMLVIALIILFTRYFGVMYVMSDSMQPTLHQGDLLFVLRSQVLGEFNKGDVLVFKSNDNEDKLLVKRLAGVGGDVLGLLETGSVVMYGDVDSETDIIKKWRIPAEKLFFLGDNSEVSYDSRVWENPYVSKNSVIGKVVCVLFPIYNFGVV